MQTTTARLVDDGICGTRSRRGERTDIAQKRVQGAIGLNPTKVELDFLLPYILGGTESTDTFPVAEALSPLFVLVDKVNGKYKYSDCYVSRASFASSSGQRLKLSMDMIGKTCDDTVASVPSVNIDTGKHLVHHQATLTIGGTAYKMETVTLTVDNKVEAYFDNTVTAHTIEPTDREVMLECTIPYSNAIHTLYQDLNDSGDNVAITLAYDNGPDALSFSLGYCVAMDLQDPSLPGRGRIPWQVKFQAFQNGSTKEIVTSNSTT
jgi:hypothetical protein